MLTSRYVACAACGAMNVLSDQQRRLRPAHEATVDTAPSAAAGRRQA